MALPLEKMTDMCFVLSPNGAEFHSPGRSPGKRGTHRIDKPCGADRIDEVDHEMR